MKIQLLTDLKGVEKTSFPLHCVIFADGILEIWIHGERQVSVNAYTGSFRRRMSIDEKS
jgi:hypothetical protein